MLGSASPVTPAAVLPVATHWRLALMFDAPARNLPKLEAELAKAAAAIRAVAASHPVRLGVADHHPDLAPADGAYDVSGWRSVDGAIEVTFTSAALDQITQVCRALRPIVETFTDMASVDIMTGPMFQMVPVLRGGTFLSLAFRRDAAITSAQFRNWWFHQHAPMAIPVLGSGLLAYDQVHVDMTITQAAAAAFGVPAVEYDAYDNLTWHDRHGFIQSCSDTEGMTRLNQDELGHIGQNCRRHALMYEVG